MRTTGGFTATAAALALGLGLGLAPVSWGSASAGATTAAAAGSDTASAHVDASNPYTLVKTAAHQMLQSLDAHRAEYRHDPSKLRQLIDQTLLPYFDREFAARLVLGRHWRTATPDQRQRFINAFYNSLVNNYGNALLDFTADRLQVLPYRPSGNPTYATVYTRVRKNDGSVVQVNYSLRHTDQGWKVWDVVVEGISYDKSFQQDFNEQIDREGLDAVIARLEHGETPAAIKRTTGG